MAFNGRLIGAGIGAVAAAGAAIYGAVNLRSSDESAAAGAGKSAFEVCLKADIAFIEGATRKCYAPAEAAALAESPVLDDQRAPVVINLSHPTDLKRSLEPVSNCAQYRALTRDGWYALSSLEMRREAYFQRACGVLDMIEQARAAEVTYFDDGAASEADMRSVAATAKFRIGPDEGAPSPAPTVSKAADGVWIFDSGDQSARLQEIAHADFSLDGRGDMLVFVTLAVQEATASLVGLLDKPSADGPVSFIAK